MRRRPDARPGAGAGELRVTVTPPDESSEDVDVDITVTESDGTDVDLHPRRCGPGCGQLARPWQNGTTVLKVTVNDGQFSGGTATLDIDWPPSPDAAGLLARAVAATRGAPAMTVEETVTSGPGAMSGPDTLRVDGKGYLAAQPYPGGADDVHRLPDDAGFAVLAFRVTGADTPTTNSGSTTPTGSVAPFSCPAAHASTTRSPTRVVTTPGRRWFSFDETDRHRTRTLGRPPNLAGQTGAAPIASSASTS